MFFKSDSDVNKFHETKIPNLRFQRIKRDGNGDATREETTGGGGAGGVGGGGSGKNGRCVYQSNGFADALEVSDRMQTKSQEGLIINY